jgi:hypothetical protein
MSFEDRQSQCRGLTREDVALFEAANPDIPPQTGKPCVYWIKAGDAVKIGIARDPFQRLADLQIGNHETLELVYAADCEADGVSARDFECVLHEMLAPLHIRGEWFKDDLAKQEVGKRLAWAKCKNPTMWQRWWSPRH